MKKNKIQKISQIMKNTDKTNTNMKNEQNESTNLQNNPKQTKQTLEHPPVCAAVRSWIIIIINDQILKVKFFLKKGAKELTKKPEKLKLPAAVGGTSHSMPRLPSLLTH